LWGKETRLRTDEGAEPNEGGGIKNAFRALAEKHGGGEKWNGRSKTRYSRGGGKGKNTARHKITLRSGRTLGSRTDVERKKREGCGGTKGKNGIDVGTAKGTKRHCRAPL